jgi:GTP-binding protein
VDVSSASGREPVEDFDTIRDELRRFNEQVAAKPQIVVATKIDALDDPARLDSLHRHVRKKRLPFVKISAVSGDGLDELLETIWRGIVAAREAAASSEPEAEDEGIDLITPSRLRHDA